MYLHGEDNPDIGILKNMCCVYTIVKALLRLESLDFFADGISGCNILS